jgi:hypothetical protein
VEDHRSETGLIQKIKNVLAATFFILTIIVVLFLFNLSISPMVEELTIACPECGRPWILPHFK